MDILEVADALKIEGLRAFGREQTGPCPKCGGDDRFSINGTKGVWQCRRCATGGDVIQLVRHVLGCDFPGALTYLCGERAAEISEAELERRRRRRDETRRQRERQAENARRASIEAARAIWRSAGPADGTDAQRYLAGRGVDPVPRLGAMPKAIRFAAEHPYRKQIARGRLSEVLHTGPAMICAVQSASDQALAVHQTWVDAARPGQKAVIEHNGEAYKSKLVRGSKKGGAIRLATPPGATTLVMGEGIETTLSALVCDAIPGAAYWAGVDLGNMGGRLLSGKGLRFAGLPNMDDAEAWVAPPWCRRLVFIQDGDSDPRDTRARLLAGLRRSMRVRPGLVGELVHAGRGRDLNDALRGVPEQVSEGAA